MQPSPAPVPIQSQPPVQAAPSGSYRTWICLVFAASFFAVSLVLWSSPHGQRPKQEVKKETPQAETPRHEPDIAEAPEAKAPAEKPRRPKVKPLPEPFEFNVFMRSSIIGGFENRELTSSEQNRLHQLRIDETSQHLAHGLMVDYGEQGGTGYRFVGRLKALPGQSNPGTFTADEADPEYIIVKPNVERSTKILVDPVDGHFREIER